jgi:hypothetical protein
MPADTEWHPVGVCCLHLVAVHDDHCLEPDCDCTTSRDFLDGYGGWSYQGALDV